MSAEMKACPFCGGKPHSRTEIGLDGIGCFYWFECSTCCARSGEKLATETCPQFYEEVRDAWNHRTDLSQASVAAALEAAKAAIAEICPHADVPGGNTVPNTFDEGTSAAFEVVSDLITPAQHDALAAHVAAEVAKARAEEFNRGVRAGCYAALAHLDRHDYREDVTRSGLQDEILAAQIGAKP